MGIIGLVACIAAIVLLSGGEWPRAPRWLRITAVVLAIPLFGLAAIALRVAFQNHESMGALPLLGLAIATGVLGLWLLGWAWVGRLRPGSLLAILLVDRPTTRSAAPRASKPPR